MKNCYIENTVKDIDWNLRVGSHHDWFDKQEYLDAVIAHAERRRTTEPRGSSKTRHGAGRSR